MNTASRVSDRHLNWARVVSSLCGLLLASTALAGSKLGQGSADIFTLSSSDSAAGTKTFEAEDFMLLSNSLGELRLEVIGTVDRPTGSRQTLRFVFDDYFNEPLHIVLSQSNNQGVSLTFAVPGLPALWFEKRPGESFVRHEGLLEPHSDAHFDQMLKYGIHTGRIEDFMRPAVDPELIESLSRFEQFVTQLGIEVMSGGFDLQQGSDAWLQARTELCAAMSEITDGLLLSFGSEYSHLHDAGTQSWSCVAAILGAAGGSLTLANSQACLLCAASRGGNTLACSQCAALVGTASGALIVAILECFGEEPDPEPTPPPPPPAPNPGDLPFPYPAPGGGMMVPIWIKETYTVWIDGVPHIQIRWVITWIWVQQEP